MRLNWLVCCALLSALCCASGLRAATYPNRIPDGSGGYTLEDLVIKAGQSQTWTAAGSPYIVERNIAVEKGGLLTIEAGATVKFTIWEAWHGPVRTGMCVDGTLKAVGAAGSPITFTSGQTPQAGGDWDAIYLGPEAGASELRYCTIAYGGHGVGCGISNYTAPVFIDRCSPAVTNCTISYSAYEGMILKGSQATVQGNEFREIGVSTTTDLYPIRYESADTLPVLSGNTFTGKGLRAVAAVGGISTKSGRWRLPGPGVAYHLRGNYTFEAGTTFGLDPGVTVRFADFNTGMWIYGTLDAQGTAAQPITLKGMKDGAMPGDWLGLYLSPASGASVLKYVNMVNSGSGGYNANGLGRFHGITAYPALWIDSCAPAISDCAFSDNYSGAIGLYASSATIRNSTFHNVYTTSHDILFETPDCFPVMSGNAADGTGVLGVGVRPGTGNASGLWPVGGTGFRYDILGDVTFAPGTTLTLEPGVTVEFAWQARLTMNGALNAVGTEAAPITFTSQRTDPAYPNDPPRPGDWKGVYLGPDSGASALSHCTFAYGGSSFGVFHNVALDGMLLIDSCSPSVTDSKFRFSSSHGMALYGGHATVRNNTFQEINGYYGDGYAIYYAIPDTFPDIGGNSGTTTRGTMGVGIAGGTIAASGKWPVAGTGFDYYPAGDITVDVAATLTVDPGVTVKPSWLAGLYVNGTLSARGTAAAPITFTTRYTPAAKGQWRGISLAPTAGASALTFCTLSYAGQGMGDSPHGWRDAALFVDSIAPVLECLTVSDSSTNGILFYGGNATLRNSVVAASGMDGVRVRGGSTTTLSNVTVAGSGYSGVHAYDSSPAIVNSIVSHSGDWGVRNEGTGTPAVRFSDVAVNASGDYTGMADPTPANGTMKADPLFVDRLYGDFRLTSASPCIDAGDNAAVASGSTDRSGGPRIYGGTVDMGAYEATSSLITAYQRTEVVNALKFASGLLPVDAATLQRLNLEPPARIDILDVLRLLRKVFRTDVNP